MIDFLFNEAVMAMIGVALVAALVIIAFGKIILSMVGRFFGFWLKLPVLAKVILPAVLIVFCLHGSMKNRGAFLIRSPTAVTVSDIDIERGFKLESVVTNAAYSYELASNAVRNAAWHLAGGYSAFNRYNLGWSFPMGENAYDHIIAFQEGSVFHNPRDEYPLFRLYDGVLSFAPGYSDFWSLIDEKRGVFTWHNVLPYDKTNEVVSVQLEIIKNGDFTIHSNELENVYRRINPDDWDNDGLANEVDNTPKSYDGDFFGVASPLPEGALESAYCWVDLCVTGVTDIATVRVTCDGPSDLGDQVIIARTNEVFRVPLLKGAYYDIESTLPICVVDQSSDNIDIQCNDCWEYHIPSVSHHYLSVSYYVDFWLENNGNLCELKSSENIGAAVSDVSGACCKSDITSLGFRWCCNASCNCGGDHEHYLDGLVSWEGYTTWLGSWVYCACMVGDAVETDGGAKISVSFKNDVIIFENTYTNAPNDVVPLRSTVNTLRVSAYGGEYGGVLEIDVDDGNRLVWCDGDVLMSPIEIAAGEREELRIDYTACTNSETINDIAASVRFSEYFSGSIIDDTATMTAVRVRLSAQVEAPECDLRDRHKFGIYEKVGCRQYPSSPQLSWVPIDGTITSDESIFYDCFYQCPIHKAERSLKVGKDSVFYLFDINVVEPSLVISRNVEAISYGLSENSAGGIGMACDLYIGPMDVSFSNIFVEEVPSTKGTRSGYFNSSYFQGAWYHSVANGAGRWLYVDVSNKSGSDVAAWTNRLLRMNDAGLLVEDTQYSWRNGHIEWEVPYGWHTNSLEESYAPYKRFAEDVRQRFQITTDGTVAVEKFGNIVMRMTNDWQFLNGVRVK